ncbi:MAG TPA: serine/threonine-protein kinase [Ktedonobacteraceae bacterium]
MSELMRYCPHCGAANAVESQTCFSCQRPFAGPEETARGIVLQGRYQLLTQVGSGGFGGVYRSVDTADAGRVVAVKQITLRGLSTQEVIEATDGFNREVSLLSKLRHPNLPAIHDTFTDPEHWYVVMDFIEGETLETYLKSKPRASLSLKETLEIGLQLCSVLNYLHTREPAIIFRDLKPSNVMRTPRGRIYLIDFGIARLFSPGKTRDTMPFGSPGYAAPEQYGRAQTTPQADLYSLGALLHCLLTGHDPADSPFRFAPLPIADSAELAELDTLIQRMVATAQEERPASAIEVQGILQRLAEGIRQREWQPPRFGTPPPQIWPMPPVAPTPNLAPRPALTRRGMLVRGLKIGCGVVAGAGALGLCGSLITVLNRPRFSGVAAQPPPSPPVPKQAFIYRGHTGPITALSWSPDGTMVASGSVDRTVQVWRASDGALLYTLSGYNQTVTCISWASDRQDVIASAGNDDGTVQVWDALRDHRDLTWRGDGRVLTLDWKHNSPWIVSGGTDQDIYTWNATTGKRGASYRGHKGDINAVLWLPGAGTTASAATGNSFTPLSGPGINFTPTPGATPTPPPTPPPASTPSYPTPTPTLSTLQKAIASGGADGTVQIWDAGTGKNILSLNAFGPVNGLVAFPVQYAYPDMYLAAAIASGAIHLWLLQSEWSPSGNIEYRGHRAAANAVTALTKRTGYYGQLIASASDDKTVQIWPVHYSYQEKPLITYTAHQAPVKAVAASPVDNRLVSGDSNGLVHLWTVQE